MTRPTVHELTIGDPEGNPESSRWRYAVGMFGTSLPINLFVTYMAFFYIDSLNMDVRAYAGVMVGYAIIDALDNPIYGYLSDRTRSRWGRRRPWLVLGGPLLAISLVVFFSPPAAVTGTALVVYFAVFAVLTQTLDSLVNTNYGALLPELFPQEATRARVNALRQAFQLVAIIISVALTPVIAGAIGYSATAMIFGAVGATFVVSTGLGARERPDRLAGRAPRVLETVRQILTTRNFWFIALASGLYSSGAALLLAGAPFFVKYALDLPVTSTTFLLATVIVASIPLLALWARAVARWGALRVWRVALVVFALSFAPMYVASSLATAIAAGVVIALGYSGVMASIDVVVARLIDEDHRRSGLHREAMVIAAFGFFNRLNGLVKSLAFLAVFAFFGFQSGDVPGEQPDQAARFLMTVFPPVLVAVAALLSRFVRFEPAAPAR